LFSLFTVFIYLLSFISYAKISKKVNVHKLKTDIWKTIEDNLKMKLAKQKKLEEDLEKEKEEEKTKKTDILTFQSIVDTMSQSNSQKDASMQYYFICLLHLANENVRFLMEFCYFLFFDFHCVLSVVGFGD
jgi:regulator of replication initiation timing